MLSIKSLRKSLTRFVFLQLGCKNFMGIELKILTHLADTSRFRLYVCIKDVEMCLALHVVIMSELS